MKIVYVKPILEKIHNAKNEAMLQNKIIDHIELNYTEAREFREKACRIFNQHISYITSPCNYDGIKIVWGDSK